jgi:hypothetical protein
LQCPDGYHCASNRTCWQNGQDPTGQDDLGAPDLSHSDSAPPVDLALADMNSPPDLTPLPDLAIPDGNHLGHLDETAGGAVAVSAAGTHRATISLGQPLVGDAAGASHRIQFGLLRGAVTK